MPGIRWTKEQQAAIEARGGSLLVSAAAGSGKTAVLSERVLRRIIDPIQPVDIDRLLIVTYTRAAAQQMRDKIAAKLQALLDIPADDPDLERDGPIPDRALLRRQQLLLGRAQISTIHAFCFDLIRQNAQALGLPPDLSIGDEREIGTLRDQALRECAEEYYRGERGAEFTELAELINSGRDDRALLQTIGRLYDFIRSHPFYEDWLRDKLALYDPSNGICETAWGRILLDYTRETLEYCLELADEALSLCAQSEAMQAAYAASYQIDRERLAAAVDRLKSPCRDDNSWDALLAAIPDGLTAIGRVTGEKGNPAKERIDAIRKELRGALEKLHTRTLCCTAAQFREDVAWLRSKIELLFEVTMEFSRRLDALKLERRLVDFSDLEHFALSLLYDTPSPGVHHRSALAQELAERYEEIMIDEYQDSNRAQDMIFGALARQREGEPENLFLVGDVKQSIYRFRQAMPEIFLEKKERYAIYDGTAYPAKIDLGANFRSRAGITGAVNFLFRQLMSERLGELDYGDSEALLPRANYPPREEPDVELQIIDRPGEAEEDKTVLEARFVARRIAELLTGGFRVSDGEGGTRPLTQSDCCILLRSKKDRLGVFLKELSDNGVNACAEAQGGFLSTREVSVVLSLLRAIDNPLLDVPMAAVMLSELFGFTPDDLARLRLTGRKQPLYLCACRAAEEGDKKCAALVDTLARYSRLAASEPADRLLARIYQDTDYPAIVSALPMGENRRANLRLLVEYAAGYGKSGRRGLDGFVRFIDRVVECGSDFIPAGTLGETADAVRVMTIHRSKGLEFPVVFLCDTAKLHNTGDYTRERTILHPEYGFACRRRDYEQMKEYTTLPMEALKLECERAALSEELRVLYVALTRAKEKLVVTMVQDRLPAKLKSLAGGLTDGEKIPAYAARRCKSFADWLLLGLLRHPDGGALREQAGLPQSFTLPADFALHVAVNPPLTPAADAREVLNAECTAEPEEPILEELRRRTAYRDPHAAAQRIPAKLGVSAIAHAQEGAGHRFSRTPKFLTGEELTGAQRGSALHQFMQFADYGAAYADLTAELSRMTKLEYLTPVQRDSIDPNKLKLFFDSPLYRRIAASKEVRRELRFLSRLPAREIGFADAAEEDLVTVQGVADCVFWEDNACVIVDYKTDRVKTPQELADRYRAQLALYRRIIEESLSLPVKQCILYSFALDREVCIE